MKKITLLFLLIPFFLLAQNSTQEIQDTLDQNATLIDQFAQLAPMCINPYLTVFLTSLSAKIGFHNDFVATNPFFNNWFITILFGVLFLFTASVGTVFKTNKATAPIALVDNYLSNHAALLINGFIMLAPTIFSSDSLHEEVVYQAGFLSVSFKTILVLITSMYFLVIVMSVRFFLDILIFFSPFPLIDSALEISKIIVSLIFVFISIISPMLSVIISVLMFIVALIFYRRSVRLIQKTKYLIIYPILNLFRSKEKILTNGESFSILIYTANPTEKIKKGRIVRLEKENEKFYIVKNRFLRSNIKEEIDFSDFTIDQKSLSIKIMSKDENITIILNRSYHKYIEEIAETLGITIETKANEKIPLNTKLMHRLKNMFQKNDITELKAM
ncbi:hypothetical protein [Aquimarina algicola]|uniref:Uncharacterized protein n=1 Tax=Aquimarina algicola TaxID=2589995 RepID=A0A504JGW7_9FLAO|nr:hypothetical protein [Aquimarina algicola]TPN86913.1 hypothetical protein FHK87_04740 [Aquimarina algicola]